MDSLTTQYPDVVEKILLDYANFLGNDDEIQVELVFDRERDRYLLVEAGWQNGYRIYGTLLHIDIINNKLWIQHDGTEEGIAGELVAAGIPKDHIVLGFKSLEERKHTDFAIS
ncbi:MAG: XisI protein [Stigonema ocellatum SAG 48.90 = DSM 106950]|nr:XisI protein [Stigonema ocellatum SAG 48.90 = DSM 106950]